MSPLLEIFEKLVAFPSVSRDGNIDLIRYVASLLTERGISVQLFPEGGDRASLFATVGPHGPGGIVLSGHTDVVPVDGQGWTSDPFRLREQNGRLYGRGAADMKGFVACALDTFLNLSPATLTRPLHLALSYDEEIGCVGVRPMIGELVKKGLKPDWVLVGEPTSMQIATGHKGKIAARATCCGRAAHSALAPQGLNAIHLAADFLSGMRQLQGEIETGGARDDAFDVPYSTIHAGLIHGGTALNIVPGRCDLDFEIRNLPGDDPKRILDQLFDQADIIRRAARKHAAEADIRISVLNEYPALQTAPTERAVQSALALSGATNKIKVAYGTEGGLFQAAFDVPVVICGPGSMDQGHKPDEYVERCQLLDCQAMLARMVATHQC